MSHEPQDQHPHHPGHEHCDHDHDHDHEHGDSLDEAEFSDALVQARVGLRSEVRKLVDVLDKAHVYIPLAEDLPEAPVGETLAVEGDLTFRPHMILNSDASIFAVAYSEPAFAEPMHSALGWTTSGEDLKFICVPAHVAFELSGSVLDGEQVSGLVFNPGTDTELVLLHDEAASLLQGVAIPLVGYVADLPPDAEGATEIVEGADPPPPALLVALADAKQRLSDVKDVQVATTYNAERDREPHLTITITLLSRPQMDRQELADQVMEHAAEHLPAPGYADIVFVDAPN